MFIHDLMAKAWPLEINHSLPFCEYEVGDYFEEASGVYRLLYRDITKVRIVHMNRWTRIWWGGPIKAKQENREQTFTRNDIFKRKG